LFKNLSPGAIGIRGLSLAQQIDLAAQAGFDGIDFSIREAAGLADRHGIHYVRDLFEEADVRPGQWGLPVAWRDEDQWQEDLGQLGRLAAVGRELGCTRTATWCPPGSDERDYKENFAWHAARFGAIARVLCDNGCRLGIEFIGPKTLRAKAKYTFIYTLDGMMELARAIADKSGTASDNVGLLLDAWHLYTSGGSIADLDRITAQNVVTVHVNDAPRGLTMAEYIDNDRRLPMETGVIDLPGFVRKLAAMGYDGPVTPEPFSARVNAIDDPLQAAQLVAEHMEKLWQAGGLP
jgi:sugar phosphate isomerase/epimerase